MPVTAVDLFAGAGGLSTGLTASGVQVKWAAEIDAWAAATYEANHRSTRVDCVDLTSLTESDMQSLAGCASVDVVAGGPPCQGFSHSNIVRRDPKDPRNSLFRDYLRAVRAFSPTVCLMENVRGLLTARDGSGRLAIDTIMEEFSELGYDADFQLVNAVQYGVPQYRERLIIIATRRGADTSLVWPAPTHATVSSGHDAADLFGRLLEEPVTLWDAISDLPQIEGKMRASDYEHGPRNDYQVHMRAGATELTNHEPMEHTARIRARFEQIGYGESEAHAIGEHMPRSRLQAGRPGRTYSQNSRRQRPDAPCSTVVASSHTNFIHPYMHRNFTVRELARVQSFPDRFRIHGKRAVLSWSLSQRKGYFDDLHLDQRAQVGNAVPPLLAQALGESISKALRHRESRAAAI
jgi:DNA (cytosine-5)-methyltransferase 1